MKPTTIFAVLATARICEAFWRMECHGRVGLARLDPLVSPKEVSSHIHVIHGSSGFSDQATYEDLVKANCTSCAVTQDKSAYWTPALYFQHTNGSYELVPQVGGMLAYYNLNLEPGQTSTRSITAFPEGFRMIAGDSLRRNYTIMGNGSTTITDASQPDPGQSFWAELGQTGQQDLTQRAIGFNCLNYHKQPEANLYRHYLPEKSYLDANCSEGVRMELSFPSCWNGKDLDSSNHQSHVAYPDLVLTGHCPKDFPVRLPGLMFETIWATNVFKGVAGRFVLSNGDVDGFGYHGDFIMGWPSQKFLQQAVDECTNFSGMIKDCPLFDIVGDDVQSACSIDLPGALTKERVLGVIGTTLPGGVEIQYGPAEATLKHPGLQSVTVAKPTVGYQPGIPYASGEPTLGQVFHQSPVSSTTSAPLVQQPIVTPPPAASSAVAEDPNAVSTKWVTEGNEVNEIVYEEVTVTVVQTEDVVVTETAGLKGRRHQAHMAKHGRRRVRA